MSRPKKILFVCSEAAPLVKTGGLGDVAGGLPPALKALRKDIRIVLPGYRAVLQKVKSLRVAALLDLKLPHLIRVLEGHFPDTRIPLWIIDSPAHYDREGGPYASSDGTDWPDNAERFALLAKAVEQIALDKAGLNWRPDVVHCNDWQTGLIPALLSAHSDRPATVFTIHNLAYQGNFPASTFSDLQAKFQLPTALFRFDTMEFYNQFSFIKGGLALADRLNTVSQTYAKEIRSPEFGCGLDPLLNFREHDLEGILNGADYEIWNPAKDGFIAQPYDADSLDLKIANKQALQKQFGLPQSDATPVIGMVGRLVHQKGGDLVLNALPELLAKHEFQLVVLGSGDPTLEKSFTHFASLSPQRVAVRTGFSESLAHVIEAGADMFLMPSRFEPCGLNQMYSLRYGTVPIVRYTGGLADTVHDVRDIAKDENGNSIQPTGFVFVPATVSALQNAVARALNCYTEPAKWRQIARNGMHADFSWARSAQAYLKLYANAEKRRANAP